MQEKWHHSSLLQVPVAQSINQMLAVKGLVLGQYRYYYLALKQMPLVQV